MRNRYLLIIYVILVSFTVENTYARDKFLIISAFKKEIEYVERNLDSHKEKSYKNIKYLKGKLGDSKVYICYSGFGKVNASYISGLLINLIKPDYVIITGIAGALSDSVQPGSIVIGDKVVCHDCCLIVGDTIVRRSTINPFTNEKNQLFFKSDSLLLSKVKNNLNNWDSLDISFGTIATGDAFIASNSKKEELFNSLSALAVECESAAIAQICYYNNTPFLIVRSISDEANNKAIEDMEKSYLEAAKNSSKLIFDLINK